MAKTSSGLLNLMPGFLYPSFNRLLNQNFEAIDSAITNAQFNYRGTLTEYYVNPTKTQVLDKSWVADHLNEPHVVASYSESYCLLCSPDPELNPLIYRKTTSADIYYTLNSPAEKELSSNLFIYFIKRFRKQA